MDQLVLKNVLAEDEAHRLRKFSAEILKHNNPAQRIVYVDCIPRDLHELKHKLPLLSTRHRDAAYVDNDDLRVELGLYKSARHQAALDYQEGREIWCRDAGARRHGSGVEAGAAVVCPALVGELNVARLARAPDRWK